MSRKKKYNKLNKIIPHSPEIMQKKGINTEEGWSGIIVTAGRINWEYNVDLIDPLERYPIYKEMRSDGTVDTALNLLELPFKSMRVHIQPASVDPTDQLIARFVNDQLIANTLYNESYSFLQHCIEASKMLQYGVMPFEILQYKGDWIDEDGTIYPKMNLLKKLAVRYPVSIRRWIFDRTKNRGLDGIEQYYPQGDIVTNFEGHLFIPIEKLVIYTNDKLGTNWEGVSVLRSAYKHWYLKNNYYKIEGVGIHKNAIPTPYGVLQYPSSNSVNKMQKIIRSWGTNEEAGFVIQKDIEDIKMLESKMDSNAIGRAINHHDSKILQSVFGNFMLLGQESRGGARNLGTALIELYMMNVESLTSVFCDYINRFLIPKIVSTNFSNVVKYPKMSAISGRLTDKLTVAQIAQILVETGLISSADVKTKEWVKDSFGIPSTEGFYEKNFNTQKQNVKTQSISKGISNKGVNEGIDLKIPKSTLEVEKNSEFLNKFYERIHKTDLIEVENFKNQIYDKIKNGEIPIIDSLNSRCDSIYRGLYRIYKDNINEDKSVEFLTDKKIKELKLDLLSKCFE